MKLNCKYSDKQNTDIAVHKEQISSINNFIVDLKENHLEHIYSRLNSIEKNQAYYAGGTAVVVVVTQFIMYYLLKW